MKVRILINIIEQSKSYVDVHYNKWMRRYEEKKERENSSIEAPEDSNTDETATNQPALVRNQQNDKQEFKEFDILLSEMLDSFIAAPQQKRKWILQMMKDATYGGK